MDRELIYIGSITRAMKAKEILKSHGIMAHIERTTDTLDTKGCGYAILIFDSSKAEAEKILSKHNIKLSSK
ncbi:MAG: DUF3343 domain-containing protein [Clostridia bacterium]|nr:DUF3343 domain-containing protein [Clostridia bacterium]